MDMIESDAYGVRNPFLYGIGSSVIELAWKEHSLQI